MCEWMKQQLLEQRERRKRGEYSGYAHCSCCHTEISSFSWVKEEPKEEKKKEE